MLGSEQAKAMVDAWSESTQKVWEGWAEVFAQSTSARTAPAAGAWSDAAVRGVRARVDQALPAANTVFGRFLPDPGPLSSLFEASTAVWDAIGRQVAGMSGPQGMFNAYLGQLASSPFRLPELGAAAQDLGELWALYVEALQTLSRPWSEMATGSSDLLDPSVHDLGLVKFSELSWDVLERTFGRLLQSPSIGFTRELNEKLLGAFSSWLEFRRANIEYQVALSTALTESTTKFLRELAARAGKGEPISSLRELLRLWGDTLDEVLIESFRSDEYARIQGRLVRAAMAYRIREREAVDVLLKIGHVPTRRDIDEVARSIYDLRKEVRGVSKLVHQTAPQKAGPEAVPVKAEATPKPPEVKAEAKPPEVKAEIGAKAPEPKPEPPAAKPQASPSPKNNRGPAGRGKASS